MPNEKTCVSIHVNYYTVRFEEENMKRKVALCLSFITTLVISAMIITTVSAQKAAKNKSESASKTANTQLQPAAIPLLVEDFTYPAGSALTNNGWTAHNAGGTNPIVTSAPSLSVTGYPSSGIGNAVSLFTSGEDDNRTFAVQTSGSVYAGFMVNASEAAVDPIGGYFFHLGPNPIGSTFRGRVFIKKDASGNIAFGISKAGSTDPLTINYTPFSYALNTTYLVILKYTIVAGATNDTVDLFISTTTPASEPAPTISAPDVTASDTNPASVSLRQGATATSPTVRVDGIRVGTTWESITQPFTLDAANDINGDGRSDYTVVRNVGGGPSGQIRWYYNTSGTGSPTVALDWGLAADFFLLEDFDGDNKDDITVWRPGAPGSAAFYILQSLTNTARIDVFGQNGDNPKVVGDYDGDNIADTAVYRPGANAGDQSFWYYRGSLTPGVITTIPWGLNGDFEAPGDYDGDGKNDFVIQRNNGGGQAAFWRRNNDGSATITVFGTPTDNIVPGDYDGDGKTDLAVFRGIGGIINWFWLRSSDGAIVGYIPFGVSATDFSVQGDYNGDGITDIGVWHPSVNPNESVFIWRNTTNGSVEYFQLGQSGDYPVANWNRH